MISVTFQRGKEVVNERCDYREDRRVNLTDTQVMIITGYPAGIRFEPRLVQAPSLKGVDARKVDEKEVGALSDGQFCLAIGTIRVFGKAFTPPLKEPDNSLVG